MRGLATRPPRLGFPLLLSAILSTTAAILHFTTGRVSMGSFYLPLLALNSAYYFVRYVQRRAFIQRDVLAGGDGWPTTPIFPGKTERANYPSAAFFGVLLTALQYDSILPSRSVSNMRWPEDYLSIVLIITYLLGLAATALVCMQARRVRQVEDKIMCSTAHEMRCERCKVEQAALDKPQDPLPTRPRVLDALPMSLSLSAVQCGALLAVMPAKPDTLWALIVCAGLTIVHRFFFLLRVKRTDWPTTRLFPSKTMHVLFHGGNYVVFLMSIIALMFGFADERLSWRAGASARVVLVAQLAGSVSNFLVFLRSVEAAEVETRVMCEREGHRWKCQRFCSAQDTETRAERKGEPEKVVQAHTRSDSTPFA